MGTLLLPMMIRGNYYKWIVVVTVLIGFLCPAAHSQVSLGRFVYNGHGLQGEVIVLNERQYRIKGFSYDGQGPAVWHTGMRKGAVGVYSQDAYAFRNEDDNCDRLGKRYRGKDVLITLPRNMSISRDIESISVYCYRFCHNFGHVKVPRGLRVPEAPRGLRGGGVCRTGHAPCSRDGTRDNAVCKDNRGREGTCPLNGGGSSSGNRGSSSSGRRGSATTSVGSSGRRPPATSSRRGFATNRFAVSNGPRRIGRFISHANGVVGDVSILNDKQFRIRGFGYNGARGKTTYFLLMEKGEAGIFSVKGWAVPDERGKCSGLRGYRNEDVVITIPSEISLSNVGAIAVYDYENCVNFGHVRVPEDLGVIGGGRVSTRGGSRKVCLPYFRPCSRRVTKNDGVCRSRKSGFEFTC